MKKRSIVLVLSLLLAAGIIIWLVSVDLENLNKILIYCIIGQTLLILHCCMIIHKLHRQANTDSLTGICNRRCFFSKMSAMLKMKLPITLMMIDIDNFKKVNDTFGHLAGDKALIQIAEILKSNTRSKDIVARIGGEEFAVVLPQTSYENALKVARRIKQAIEERTFTFGSESKKLTISIGIASTNFHMHIDCLLSYADKALYKAKETKNAIATYQQEKIVTA